MENKINFVKGDATKPMRTGNKIIVHVCNDIGAWGKGFVVAISKRWSEPEKQFRQWYKGKENFYLGAVQFVQVDNGIWVANLIGQHRIKKDEYGNAPIRYEAISAGLENVSILAIENKASVHMPRIGCGLAGGTWDKIEPIIVNKLVNNKVATYIYDLL